MKPQIHLYSSSPRRKELLSALGFKVSCLPNTYVEPEQLSGRIHSWAEQLAEGKLSANAQFQDGLILEVSADTIVEHQGRSLTKPPDRNTAEQWLFSLSGKEHWVHTGVSFAWKGNQYAFTESTRVVCTMFSKEDIQEYLDSGEWKDKAGGYGIQNAFGKQCISAIHGCFYSVMGFPTSRFIQELKHRSILP